MENLPTIACMILYKNERQHLERIVEKVLAAFDQAIFVTNQEPSTDGSDELLARHGVEPQRMEWVEDFSVARQFGLERSTADYTMWMDCDDDLITGCASWNEAKVATKRFLAQAPSPFFMHRVYYHDRNGYWVRENWFRKGCGVRVKYPAHELYIVKGQGGEFPPGLVDRVNAPLKPDYTGKLWRYFDMLHRYLKETDPGDLRCRFYLAREFSGPPSARIALFLDFLEPAQQNERYMNFGEEWWAILSMFDLREHMDPAILDRLAKKLVLRYPLELTAHVLHSMVRCEMEPTEANGYRFYKVLEARKDFSTCRSPQHKSWYYQRPLNICGYTLLRISILAGSQDMARLAVKLFEEGLEDPEGDEAVAVLIRNNLKLARLWLAGFRPGLPAGDSAASADRPVACNDVAAEAASSATLPR